VEYRELNDITSKDENPLPLIQDIFPLCFQNSSCLMHITSFESKEMNG
jgi:hypothetical protein